MSRQTPPSAQAILAELNAGRFKPAYQLARRAMAAAPRDGGIVGLAALAQSEMGKPREALQLFQKAIKLDPANHGHQNNMVQALIKLGQADRAVKLAEQFLARRPDDAALLYLVAIAHLESEDRAAALGAATAAVAADPGNARAVGFRGAILADLNRDKEAIKALSDALALDPNAPDLFCNIARPLSRQGRHDEAIAALDTALAIAPGHPDALRTKAVLLLETGDLDGARAAYHAVLDALPDDADTLLELAQIDPPGALPPLRSAISRLHKKVPRKSLAYGKLGFALAHAAQRQGDADGARAAWQDANHLMARLHPYDRMAAEAECEGLLAAFPDTTPLPSFDADAGDTARPVFIVGLPRSGTTLIDQVLTAHPGLTGCGENPTTRRLVQGWLAQDTLASGTAFNAEEFASAYLHDLPDTALAATAFTDKMPMNYRYLGPLAAAFPAARFVHIERDPRDIALSLWRTWFPASDMRFSFDFAAMAHQANLYRRYVTHWQALLGDRLLTLRYEDAVADIGAASRALARHAGLDWVPEMATPETNRTPVRTASVTQVRQAVHSGSVGRWRTEQALLEPFRAALDDAAWPDLPS